jgi:Subtilase family
VSEPRPHLDLPAATQHGFLNPRRGGSEAEPPPPRNRAEHAAAIRRQLDDLATSWQTAEERLPDARGHLAAAESAEGTTLAADSLGDKRTEIAVVDSTDTTALLHVRRDDLRALQRKVTAFAERDTKGGRPRNEPLLAPLERVREATFDDVAVGVLAARLLDRSEHYWVELWTDGGRLATEDTRSRIRGVVETLAQLSDQDGPDPVTFKGTERDIYLVRLSGEVLLDITKLAPDVYRVARPADARADRLARDHQGELVDADRVEPPSANATAVAVLDTGIAEEHPLLRPVIDQPGISIVPGVLSAIDNEGHGTEMAGLAAFADLTAHLIIDGPVVSRAWIENIRCKSNDGDPPLWASRTAAAIEAAESLVERRRVFNLALSDPGHTTAERTSWSTALDQLAHNDERGRLICVAIGNATQFNNPSDYPIHNLSSFLHDPAHAVNVISVGAITHREELTDDGNHGTLTPVARAGELSPYTSSNVSSTLPIKPEIVMEGGNACPDGLLMHTGEADLSVLTTDHRHSQGHLLAWTWATSAACAAASGLTAEIWEANRGRSPQSIRALLVNSARWTSEIVAQHPDRKERLRAVGYGQPKRDIALASTMERPTLILEGRISPEQPVGSASRGMHLVRLPLPDSELLALGDHFVDLAITLSYFGEPNESRRVRYLGANLSWDLQRRGETADQFIRRVNDHERPAGQARPTPADAWSWEIGPEARGRGTVQSDRLRTDAASLAGDKLIAVWPTRGWWADHLRTRGDARIAYSLVVTVDAGAADIDLYNLIAARVSIPIDAS